MPSSSPRPRFNVWYVLIAVAVIAALWLGVSYNRFVRTRGAVTNAWAQVETQYQRRIDLVPNLVSTVKGAANFEQSTFVQVTEARNAWAQAKAIGDRSQEISAAGSFDSALSRLLVTVEAYPQLQATQAFRDLMTQLEGTENRISVARKDYNDSVFAYNITVQSFPGVLAAKVLGFTPEVPFTATPGSENAPTVDFTK
jgi:LemA protein